MPYSPISFRLLDMDGVVDALRPVPGAAMASPSRPRALSSRERCASACRAASTAAISAPMRSLSAFSFLRCSMRDW